MKNTSFSPIGRASLLSAILAAPLILGLSACGSGAAEPSVAAAVPAQKALTVTLVRPRIESWPEQVTASGNVMPWQESVIGTEVGGLRIVKVRANVGDTVRKGDVLAMLNPASVQVDVEATKASLVEAQATLAQATATLDRARRLAPAGGVSQQDLTQYETQQRTAQARLSVAQAQLKAQRLRLGYTTLVAPDDGVISARTAAEGAIVQAGSELFRMIRQNRLEWRAEVKGETLLGLLPGQPVTVKSPLGTDITGTIRQVSPAVDLATRNGLVYVDLPRTVKLKAGLYVSGSFSLGQRDAVALPQAALVNRDGKTFAFRVDAQGKVHALEVSTGRVQGDWVEIRSGLDPDTAVVAKGAGFLKAGDLVKVVGTPVKGAQ